MGKEQGGKGFLNSSRNVEYPTSVAECGILEMKKFGSFGLIGICDLQGLFNILFFYRFQ